MKILFALLLFPLVTLAQNTPLQLAEDVLSMCRANNETAFLTTVPDVAAVAYMIRNIGGVDVNDETIKAEYEKNVNKALKGFRLLQETAKELELDLNTAVITGSEITDRKSGLRSKGKDVEIPTKEVNVYFTCNNKKLIFRIADAIQLNGLWFIGRNFIAIYPLE